MILQGIPNEDWTELCLILEDDSVIKYTKMDNRAWRLGKNSAEEIQDEVTVTFLQNCLRFLTNHTQPDLINWSYGYHTERIHYFNIPDNTQIFSNIKEDNLINV